MKNTASEKTGNASERLGSLRARKFLKVAKAFQAVFQDLLVFAASGRRRRRWGFFLLDVFSESQTGNITEGGVLPATQTSTGKYYTWHGN